MKIFLATDKNKSNMKEMRNEHKLKNCDVTGKMELDKDETIMSS